MEPVETLAVGVVVERRESSHPWRDHEWRPVAVLQNAPAMDPSGPWRKLSEGEDWELYHAGTLEVELYRTATEAYRETLAGDPPSLFVVLREDEDEDSEHEVKPFAVTASLYVPNPWVIGYLRSQLAHYVRYADGMSLELDMSEMKAKTRLERALNKRHILHYQIQYRYDALFMQRLYADYADFGFDDDEHHEQIDEMLHYYTVLECPVGASQDALKKSYKKLVKVYHPDRVHCEDDATVDHYTQKFQLLQEAYSALRIVS